MKAFTWCHHVFCGTEFPSADFQRRDLRDTRNQTHVVQSQPLRRGDSGSTRNYVNRVAEQEAGLGLSVFKAHTTWSPISCHIFYCINIYIFNTKCIKQIKLPF